MHPPLHLNKHPHCREVGGQGCWGGDDLRCDAGMVSSVARLYVLVAVPLFLEVRSTKTASVAMSWIRLSTDLRSRWERVYESRITQIIWCWVDTFMEWDGKGCVLLIDPRRDFKSVRELIVLNGLNYSVVTSMTEASAFGSVANGTPVFCKTSGGWE